MSVTRWKDSVNSPSRRDFMKLLTSYLVGISGLLGLAGIGRYLSFESGPVTKDRIRSWGRKLFPGRFAHASG